jgi:hypothetical protein
MMIIYHLEWYGARSKWVVKKKGKDLAELFKGRVEPNKEYYIKPNDANMFYSTTFDPSKNIEQIEELKTCNKIWIPKESK